jgi:hypothetical protein
MEVAQALHDQRHQQARQQDKDLADDGAMHSSKLIDIATLSIATRKNATSVSQAEKRKSSYEKYSAIILPPLQEEMTPAPSPAGTLSSTGQAHREQGKAEIPHTKNHRATLAEAFSPLATAELTDADADMVHFGQYSALNTLNVSMLP